MDQSMDWSSPTSTSSEEGASPGLKPSSSNNEVDNFDPSSSNEANLMNTFTLLDLSWHDLLIPGILPYMGVDDLFRLRSASTDCKELVEVYFAVCNELDLSMKKNISLEAFQV